MLCELTGCQDQPINPPEIIDACDEVYMGKVESIVKQYIADDIDLTSAITDNDEAMTALLLMYRAYVKGDNRAVNVSAQVFLLSVDSYLIRVAERNM